MTGKKYNCTKFFMFDYLAPSLAYKYLENLNAMGLKIASDCDGKHTRIFGKVKGQWIIFDILATESDVGGKDLVNRDTEIAMSSKKLDELKKPDELTQQYKYLQEEIAQDEMVIIVNKLNPLSEINIQQLKEIVSGTFKNWSDLQQKVSCAGNDTIVFYSRPKGSGTLSEFLKAIELDDINFDPNHLPPAQIAKNHLEMAYKVAKDGCGIGYVSMPYANLAKGIAVDKDTDREVGLPRNLYFYLRNAKDYENPEIGKTVEAFIKFSTNPNQGQRVIKELGYDPTVSAQANVSGARIRPKNEFDCQSKSLPDGTKINAPILFDTNKYAINSIGQRSLGMIRQNIPYEAHDVWVVGFTDDIGTASKNKVLSLKRAEEVAELFSGRQNDVTYEFKIHKIGCGVRTEGKQSDNRAVEVWWK